MTSSAYDRALAALDQAHAQDPNKITVGGEEVPYELHYAQQMTHYLSLRAPDASDALRLAIRAQHLRRWEVSRASYSATKAGYFAWRAHLKKRQAEHAKDILLASGYGEDEAERVAALVRKEDIKSDEESQILEDVACLVFLDDQLEEFGRRQDEEKMLGILRKTWAKMSRDGRQLALKIPMSERCQELLKRALDAQAYAKGDGSGQ